MFSLLLGVAIGLIIGWNFLPQPVWVQTAIKKAKEYLGFSSPDA
jgi:hypothetical protein